MMRKLSSRKFLLALLGVVISLVSTELGREVPWDAVSVIAAYIAGEAGVDIVRGMKGR